MIYNIDIQRFMLAVMSYLLYISLCYSLFKLLLHISEIYQELYFINKFQ